MKTSKNAELIESGQATSLRRFVARIIDLILGGFVLLLVSVSVELSSRVAILMGLDSTADRAAGGYHEIGIEVPLLSLIVSAY